MYEKQVKVIGIYSSKCIVKRDKIFMIFTIFTLYLGAL